MRLQRQRRDARERLGGSTTSRPGRSMPTTPARRPSCRRPDHPRAARWLNRDPIEEKGGFNLFKFARNSPIDAADPLGLSVLSNLGQIKALLLTALNRAINRFLNSCGNGLCDERQGPCNACCAAGAIASFAVIHATVAVAGIACALLQPPFVAVACAALVGYVYIDQMISLGQAIQACQTRCARLAP